MYNMSQEWGIGKGKINIIFKKKELRNTRTQESKNPGTQECG
jgi:hypothetical protein